jgi:hypothetical protein
MVDLRYRNDFFSMSIKLGQAEAPYLEDPSSSKDWKIEFSSEAPQKIQSAFEVEQKYQKIRRNKRSRRSIWMPPRGGIDTGLVIRNGQDIMFSCSGSINIDSKTTVFQDGELNWSGTR